MTPTDNAAVATIRPSDPLAIIAGAIERGQTDAATIEKLIALVERVEDRKAADAFGKAIAAFQKECPPIPRNKSFTVKGAEIYYASFDETMDLAGPIMAKHGISATWQITHYEAEGNRISGTCRIQVGSHFRDNAFDGVPIPPLTLSNTQAYGAAMSYFRRYSLEASLGMRRTGQDNEAALTDTLLAAEVEELRALVQERGRRDEDVLAFFKVASYDEIRRAEFESAKWAVKKLSKKGGQ